MGQIGFSRQIEISGLCSAKLSTLSAGALPRRSCARIAICKARDHINSNHQWSSTSRTVGRVKSQMGSHFELHAQCARCIQGHGALHTLQRFDFDTVIRGFPRQRHYGHRGGHEQAHPAAQSRDCVCDNNNAFQLQVGWRATLLCKSILSIMTESTEHIARMHDCCGRLSPMGWFNLMQPSCRRRIAMRPASMMKLSDACALRSSSTTVSWPDAMHPFILDSRRRCKVSVIPSIRSALKGLIAFHKSNHPVGLHARPHRDRAIRHQRVHWHTHDLACL